MDGFLVFKKLISSKVIMVVLNEKFLHFILKNSEKTSMCDQNSTACYYKNIVQLCIHSIIYNDIIKICKKKEKKKSKQKF